MHESKRAVIYTRISRDDTGEARSNQRQEAECRRLTDYRRWEVVDVVEDVSMSAYSRKPRPGWQRVLRMVEAGEVDVIVAYHLDRITRNMLDLEHLLNLSQETGVGVATVLGDIDLTGDMGRMLARILAAVAQGEVERKGARQRLANQQRRAEGHRWASGWRPFGYELDGSIVPEEAELIRSAADAVLRGTPIREIARRWREAEVSTPRSQKGADGWTHNGVRSILLNPRNAGHNTYKGEIVGPGNWEPILSEDTHIQLVAKLTDPARKTNKSTGRPPANLLSGIAECASCGEKVTGGTVGRTRQVDGKRVSTGERVAVYKCPNNHLSVDREAADNLVVSAFAMAVRFDLRTSQLMPVHREGSNASALAEQAERLTDDIKALATSYADGRITLDQLELATAALRARLATVEAEIAELEDGGTDILQLVTGNVDEWLTLSTDARRRVLDRLARITLYPKGRGRKNVPIRHQVTMDLVTYWDDGTERLIPALGERPDDLPAVNTTPQQRQRARLHATSAEGEM